MTFEIKKQEANIVIIGSFNPTIFNPDWFLRHGLISQVEMEGANVEIIHRDIAKFTLNWLEIEVLSNRFVARTNDQSYFLPLKDLVVSVFSILDQTPIKQMGMNRSFDLSLQDEKTWHKFGDTLAPKDIWSKLLPERVGLLSLKVKSPRADALEGNINVTVESSRADIKNGIHFALNSHVEIAGEVTIEDVLTKYWEETLNRSEQMCETIVSEATS